MVELAKQQHPKRRPPKRPLPQRHPPKKQPPKMPATLETIPAEILQDVCAILDATHPASLLALARTSKHCYSVAKTVLYRTVKVAIAEQHQVPFRFLSGLKTRLLRDHAFQHVRRLILCAPEDDVNNDTAEPVGWPYSSLSPCERAFEDDTAPRSCWDNFEAEWYPNETSVAEDDWKPVIRLVKRLPGLTDLYWVCHEQLPLRLLNVLDSKTKVCRLHHYTFDLGDSAETSVTSYKHAILTSPSLYSIGNLCDRDFKSARNIKSPNLRRVYLGSHSREIQADEIGGHECCKVRESVSREVIHMDYSTGVTPISFSTVQTEAFGDLSALRVLTLQDWVDPRDLPPPSDFPLLESLTYTCKVDPQFTQQIWDDLTAFLHSLPRLTTLDISDWDRSISFTPALNKHLRTLKLRTWRFLDDPSQWLRDDHIHRLADLCPNLDTLDIEIPRSHGDSAEVSRYRSLGRLGRLRQLHIDLYVPPPNHIQTSPDGCPETTFDTVIEPWFDKQDAQYVQDIAPYRQGHVRDLLIDRAVDEGLARTIFKVISVTKLASRGQSSPVLLERLKLCTSGGTWFPGNCHGPMHFFMSPVRRFLGVVDTQWLLLRDVRDDARETLHAREIGNRSNVDSELKPDFNGLKDDQYWFGIWRRIWPAEREGADWWEDWKSRPLALGDDGNGQAG